jgi:hypothetical protein
MVLEFFLNSKSLIGQRKTMAGRGFLPLSLLFFDSGGNDGADRPVLDAGIIRVPWFVPPVDLEADRECPRSPGRGLVLS